MVRFSYLPDCTIESFHVCILGGLAGLDKLQFDPIIISPLPEFLTNMLRSVIQPKCFCIAAPHSIMRFSDKTLANAVPQKLIPQD
jgi:hypothetical protein